MISTGVIYLDAFNIEKFPKSRRVILYCYRKLFKELVEKAIVGTAEGFTNNQRILKFLGGAV